jgi:6-pyruvoyltetrahydropterin/6-carboxytetrahydropterin synthase
MFELSKQFRFDAAHTLDRIIQTESSRRIHGHSYRAEVTVRGRPDPVTGMVVDLGVLEASMEDARDALDHRLLDEITDLGPATMENLSRWIWNRLKPVVTNLFRVSVYRDSSGEACSYWGEDVPA